MKFFKTIKKFLKKEDLNKEDLNEKFYFSIKIKDLNKKNNTVLHKAVDKNGRFVWIDKKYFLETNYDDEFCATIFKDLNYYANYAESIGNSFNFFKNRQDFYSKYTFVKKVKNLNQL